MLPPYVSLHMSTQLCRVRPCLTKAVKPGLEGIMRLSTSSRSCFSSNPPSRLSATLKSSVPSFSHYDIVHTSARQMVRLPKDSIQKVHRMRSVSGLSESLRFSHSCFSSASDSPSKPAEDRTREINELILKHLPPSGAIKLTDLASKLPDTLMETAFPQGLRKHLEHYPSFFFLSKSFGGGFNVQKSVKYLGSAVKKRDEERASRKKEVQQVFTDSTAAPSTLISLTQLWRVFCQVCVDANCSETFVSGSSNACQLEDPIFTTGYFLKQLLHYYKDFYIFGLSEQIRSAVPENIACLKERLPRVDHYPRSAYGTNREILQAFELLEASITSVEDLHTAPLIRAFEEHVKEIMAVSSLADFSSGDLTQGCIWGDDWIRSWPHKAFSLPPTSASASAGEATGYRHMFFIRASVDSLDIFLQCSRQSILQRVGRSSALASSPCTARTAVPSPAVESPTPFASAKLWEACEGVLDYEALRLSRYLSPTVFTPLHLLLYGDEADTVREALQRPMAWTLAGFSALQRLGDIPYARHAFQNHELPTPHSSIFEWERGVEASSDWVTGVRFSLDRRRSLPSTCEKTPEELSEELEQVSNELSEVRVRRRCGAFRKRLQLTLRRRHLMICAAIVKDAQSYSLYHADVLAYYLFDHLPTNCEPGKESKAVVAYETLGELFPSVLRRQMLLSVSLLEAYPHLFVHFKLQGKRMVVRRDVFDAAYAFFVSTTSSKSNAWCLSESASLSEINAKMRLSSIAERIFDPGYRLETMQDVIQYLMVLVVTRQRRRKRKQDPVTVESLSEMLPTTFNNELKRMFRSAKSATSAPKAAEGESQHTNMLLRVLKENPDIFIVEDDYAVSLVEDRVQ